MNRPGTKKKFQTAPPKKILEKKKEVIKENRISNWMWLSAILVLTFIVFFPALNNALTNWDDPTYLTENPLIRQLNSNNIKRIFTEVYFGNYQPLHIFSYAIEYHFYKLNPDGYHTTSVIMHLMVTALVFGFILSLTENRVIAIITALLFGIHPLHVESVAWAAERKDLLYSIFFLASAIFYVKYIRSKEKAKYFVAAFLLFALSILSKAMASSLPPVLILLDIYFARKLSIKTVLEKIPFFALAIGLGLKAAFTASTTGQVSLHVFTLFERILIANFNLLAYVGKLILPINLSAFYPYPARMNGALPYYFYIAPFVVVALMILIIISLKKTKNIFFGAGFFVACIILVLQLFPVGPTIMSERYSYLPSIGFFFVIAYFIHQLINKKPALKTPAYSALAGYSLFLSVATYQRCDVWKDSMTLWTNVLQQFPYVGNALNNRGTVYGKEMGDLDHALDDFNKSIQFEPTYENAYANRGIVYCLRGKFDLAIDDFNKAIQLKPDYYDALVNRGITFIQTNQIEKAIADFNKLLITHQDDALVYMWRGHALTLSGKNNEGLADLNKSITLKPDNGETYFRRSNTLYNLKQYKEAFSDVQQALNLGYKVDDKYFATLKNASEN